MNKRLLSTLLALCMVASMAFPVLAQGTETTETAETTEVSAEAKTFNDSGIEGVVCTELAGCIDDKHDAECPLFVEPEPAAALAKTALLEETKEIVWAAGWEAYVENDESYGTAEVKDGNVVIHGTNELYVPNNSFAGPFTKFNNYATEFPENGFSTTITVDASALGIEGEGDEDDSFGWTTAVNKKSSDEGLNEMVTRFYKTSESSMRYYVGSTDSTVTLDPRKPITIISKYFAADGNLAGSVTIINAGKTTVHTTEVAYLNSHSITDAGGNRYGWFFDAPKNKDLLVTSDPEYIPIESTDAPMADGWYHSGTNNSKGIATIKDGKLVVRATGAAETEYGFEYYRGPFTKFNGYSSTFPKGGFTTSVTVDAGALVASDPTNDSFAWSTALNNTDGTYLEEIIVRFKRNSDGTLVYNVGGKDTDQYPHALDKEYNIITITSTFGETAAGKLSGSVKVNDALYTDEFAYLNNHDIKNVGGNRYGWFLDAPKAKDLIITGDGPTYTRNEPVVEPDKGLDDLLDKVDAIAEDSNDEQKAAAETAIADSIKNGDVDLTVDTAPEKVEALDKAYEIAAGVTVIKPTAVITNTGVTPKAITGAALNAIDATTSIKKVEVEIARATTDISSDVITANVAGTTGNIKTTVNTEILPIQLDITLKVGTQVKTELRAPLTFTFSLPEAWAKLSTSTLRILHQHGGGYTLITPSEVKDGKVTFSTMQLSTFALVAVDTERISSSGGGGGGGGGSVRPSSMSSTTTTTTATPSAAQPVSAATLNTAVTSAIQSAGAKLTGSAVIQNASSVSPALLKAAADTAAKSGKTVTLYFDNVVAGKILSRLYIAPAKATAVTGDINLGVKIDNVNTRKTFETYFSNNIAIVDLTQQGAFGMTIPMAVALDLSKLNTKTLHFYSYDNRTNICNPIKTTYFIDATGFLHFETAVGGDIIITDKPLAKK